MGYEEKSGIYREQTFAYGMYEFNEREKVKNKQNKRRTMVYYTEPPPPNTRKNMSPEILTTFLSSPFYIEHTPFDVEYVELPWLASSPFTFQNKKYEPHSCSLLVLFVRVSPLVGGPRQRLLTVGKQWRMTSKTNLYKEKVRFPCD
jgi:hypothetical protein